MLKGKFIKKLKHYEEDSFGEFLGVRLYDMYKKSYEDFINHLDKLAIKDECTLYLLEQLLEDRDYLHAFIIANRGEK